MIWKCEKCGREYPHEGKRIRCLCPAGGSDSKQPSRRDKCRHRGAVLRDVPCGCAGKPKVFECARFSECIVKKINHPAAEGFKCCQNCTEWEPIG